jgi:tRNA threonylcarbamoyl adenosine modification protein YeaZ
MRLLALDTSTWWCGIALVLWDEATDAPEVVAELGARVARSHAEHLPGRIDRLLVEAGWVKGEVDAYAATTGPGSFTGIRVGLGIVRGLALASGRPARGVSTLEALAEAHGPAERSRMPIIDAGRGELYAARYDAASSPPVEQQPAWLGPLAEVLATAQSAGALLIPAPGTRLGDAALAAQPTAVAPRGLAGATGCLAARGLRAARVQPPLAPFYLRPPDALLRRRRS